MSRLLNIPDQLLVGYNKIAGNNLLPDAVIIPDGTSPREIRKAEAIREKSISTAIIDNRPLPGFALVKVTNKSSYNIRWEIIDPRGFRCEIKEHDASVIMRDSWITNNIIQDTCIWVRNDDDTEVSLITTTNPNYATALTNNVLIDNKVDITAILPGDVVVLQNGLTGTYMGKMNIYSAVRFHTRAPVLKPSLSSNKHVICTRKGLYFYAAKLEVLSATRPCNAPTVSEYITSINEELKQGCAWFTDSEYNASHWTVINSLPRFTFHDDTRMVTEKQKKVTISLVEITSDEANRITGEYCVDRRAAINILPFIAEIKGVKHMLRPKIPQPFLLQPAVTSATVDIQGVAVTSIECDRINVMAGTQPVLLYGSVNAPHSMSKLSAYTKFYAIVKHVGKETYI